MTGQPRWSALHVYYFDPLDRLITEAIAPAVDELSRAGRIQGFFFVRYWQGGPHVRLRLLGTDHVAATVREPLCRYLDEHPSRTDLDAAAYRRLSGYLSRAEPGRPAVEPLRRNNSVELTSYVPELEVYGGVPAMPAVERNFTDSSRIVLDLLHRPLTETRRFGIAVGMQVRAALGAEGDAESAAELLATKHRLWTAAARPDERLLAAWDTGYRAQRDRLGRMVQLPESDEEASTAPDRALARWRTSVTDLVHRLTPLAADGRLQSPWPDAPRAVLLACLHMHANRLGVSAPQEAYANYLAWRALREHRPERVGGRR